MIATVVLSIVLAGIGSGTAKEAVPFVWQSQDVAFGICRDKLHSYTERDLLECSTGESRQHTQSQSDFMARVGIGGSLA